MQSCQPLFATDRKRRIEIANEQLGENVKKAIGTKSLTGVTMPFLMQPAEGSRLFSLWEVPMTEVVATITLPDRRLPLAGYQDVKGQIVPVLPLQRRQNETTDQATRQYVRVVAGALVGHNPQEEQSKFGFLCQMLAVVLSEVPAEVKSAFLALGITLLQKTMPGKDLMEIDHFRSGGVHGSFGRGTWHGDLGAVAMKVFGKAVNPFVVWYGICKVLGMALGDDLLAQNQYPHCKAAVPNPEKWKEMLVDLPPVKYVKVSPKSDYEFQCPVELEDTSAGGYVYPPHPWGGSGSGLCVRKEVLCESAVKEMREAGVATCAFCRHRMSLETLIKVTKATDSEFSFPPGVFNPRGQMPAVPAKDPFASTTASFASMKIGGTKEVSPPGTVISLFGTVGSGKSRAAQLIVQGLKALGVNVFVVNVDSHCVRLMRSGSDPRRVIVESVEIVRQEVHLFTRSTSSAPRVVVVDTCGDICTPGALFGCPLPGWNWLTFHPNLYDHLSMSDERWNQYLAWSLRNVLVRNNPGQSHPGCYFLNPEGAGVKTCVEVHQKKSRALFAKAVAISSYLSKETILQSVKADADAYAEFLASKSLEGTVKDFIMKIKETVPTAQ
eukprot:TRINITY_DN2674_c0_g1_i1.p1 TRINITY_DN2674_c0_g1~~TRINITY_DN2674_c0_g1_i1.p1  ORF type:complete len:609 (-),score=110.14 TRINITY_DN2674_c0_g1_i1:240-2066(-)